MDIIFGYSEQEYTIVGKIDNLNLGENHLRKGYSVDTSGLFASIPATVHVIWGYLLGMIIYKIKDKKMVLKMFFLESQCSNCSSMELFFTNKQNSMDKLICFVTWLGDYHICIFNLDN